MMFLKFQTPSNDLADVPRHSSRHNLDNQTDSLPQSVASADSSPDNCTEDSPELLAESIASVLIIHHETATRLMLMQCLQNDSYRAYSAENWEIAFACLQQQPIDLVILDLAISQQAEGGLLGQLLLLYPTIRIVMICDHCSLEDAVDAMKQGAVDFIQEPHGYLQRPFDPDRIQGVVAEALSRSTPATLRSAGYDTLMALARQCAQQHDFEQARKLIGEAIKRSPHRPEGLTLLGQITEYLGDRRVALKLYRAAIGLDPTHEPAKQNLTRAVFGLERKRPCFDS